MSKQEEEEKKRKLREFLLEQGIDFTVIDKTLLVLWTNEVFNVGTLSAFSSKEDLRNLRARNDNGEEVALGAGTVEVLWSYILRRRADSSTAQPSKKLRLSGNATTPEDEFLAGLAKTRLDGKRLVLDQEVYDTKDKVVYVRSCYEQLFGICAPLLKSGRKCTVTGTPGIGKSMFGYYSNHRLLREGVTVIYIYMGWECCHLYVPENPGRKVLETLGRLDVKLPNLNEGGWVGRFIPNGATELAQDSKELYGALIKLEGEVVVILDPPRGWGADVFKNPPCGVLVVTSPTPERTLAINSQAGTFSFYMPLWTLEEVKSLLMARESSGQISDEEEGQLKLRSIRFGNIPRYIAQVNRSHLEMIMLAENATHEVIQQLSGPTMVQVVTPTSAVPQVSGRIIHLEAASDFMRASKRFASEMIERQILVHFQRSQRHAWSVFAESVRDVNGFSQMVGVRSEIWWHSALQAGGVFTLEQLYNKTSRLNSSYRKGPLRSITSPESAARYSAKQNLSDITNLWDLQESESAFAGLYFNFLKGNAPPIDSIWVLDGAKGKDIFDPGSESAPPVYVCGVQMTLSERHTLNLRGVDTFVNLVTKLAPPGARAEILFVTDESVLKNLHYVLVKEHPDLRQWLLKVPPDRLFQ